MTRTLTITAAEWASVQDGTLRIVRDGVPDPDAPSTATAWRDTPPAEFVQACAPCGTCTDGTVLVDQSETLSLCPDCWMPLMVPCQCDDPWPWHDRRVGYGRATSMTRSTDGSWHLALEVVRS